ncbi:beta-N-acetylhexosaminidase [Paucibacter sp. Y2R2-4]|uniref:beta-N-acetylhexosaminidase n=1 Tax=Paucibacter sp. Y2R2-4 TaxID=2893553 RepID=UPI0021E4E9FC|nr:beta-N-acetylhexosaminidase [Paucibacter sp. Y2R2-4]MCV2352528.1 beta-N-acetylhexosaminidase [Paucibacter sp. Y2R2-4]
MPFDSMCSRPRAMFRALALSSLALGLQLGSGGLTPALAATPKTAASMQPVPIPLGNLLPQPQMVTAGTGQAPFLLNAQVPVLAPEGLAGPAKSLAQTLGLRLKLAPSIIANSARIRFEQDPSVGKVAGAYRLQIKSDEILIQAAEPSGAFYATQTLMQLLPQEPKLRVSSAGFELPAADISDAPRFEWRGIMLDVARHFHDVRRVKRVIDNMAFYKLNRLHLHLSDDQGWRLAIKAYPKLSTVGGRGDHSRPDAPAQFFSAEDIRSIVRYAAERYIEVIPEIDMPGHSGAAARAYPEFFDGLVTFNPAKPETYRFIDTLLGELAELFPGRYIHFGGDEVWVEKTRWAQMPEVLAMAQDLTPAGQTPQMKFVEAEFARRMVQLIQKHKRVPIGWDEVIAAGLQENMVVQWWRMDHPEMVLAALKQGQSVILSPSDRMYLDYAAGLGEPGAPWEGNTGGPVSVEKIVAWEPMPVGLSEAQQQKVLGIEAPLWTENVRSESYLEFMLYPRMAAVAEVAWRQQAQSEPKAFVKRLAPHIARWKAQGVNVRGNREDAHQYRLH